MHLRIPIALAVLAFSMSAQADVLRVTDLDLKHVEQGYGTPKTDLNIIEQPMKIAGRSFRKGLGSHSQMVLRVQVRGATRFRSYVGLDDSSLGGPGSVEFLVYGDDLLLYRSGLMRSGEPAKEIDLDLSGKKVLLLKVTPGGDGMGYDHADWAEARFDYEGRPPIAFSLPREKPYILTPKPGPEPKINGPKVFGVRPGRPILFTVPATGDRPMAFSAKGLPSGTRLDPKTGFLSGSVEKPGTYRITFKATNRRGSAERDFKLVVGDTIALTPPMGWSTWYMAYTAISDKMIRAQADAMVKTGLIQHGYSYVNIDDGWNIRPDSTDPAIGGEPRDADGNLRSNANFPDMKGMCDYVHSKGLKIGMYISPGITTCAGFAGSLGHEEQDAKLFAQWGFDFLKYDWCSYDGELKTRSLEEYKLPYEKMRDALAKVDRDMVYNLCQYGMMDVSKWGREVGGNFWRTTGDLGHAIDGMWGSMSSIGFGQNGLESYAGPGGWNDPDNILIGHIMWQGKLQPTPLTPDEQYTYMSLWSILAAPLVLAGDLTKMDAFTRSLVTNDEVIEINQDPLGRQGHRVWEDEGLEIWAKDLEDGSKAVGLFNRRDSATKMSVSWSQIGLSGNRRVRDVWRQKDIGRVDRLERTVRRHGVVFLRVF